MTDIQKARDVLAKWRDGSTPGPWGISATGNELRARDPWNGFLLGTWANGSGADQSLIVATAGNPELLDAIDMAFVALIEEDPNMSTVTSQCVATIAAAIIAADERMSE